MNKSKLVEKVRAQLGIENHTKAQIEFVLNETITMIKKTVKKDDVTLVGFGTFSKTKRKARMGRNPQTGKEIKIPARTVPKFKASKDFKGSVR
jgi:DNA-binding protein HU-beta